MVLDLASAGAMHLAAALLQPSRRARAAQPQRTVSSTPWLPGAPRACLAWRLGGFVTNRHE